MRVRKKVIGDINYSSFKNIHKTYLWNQVIVEINIGLAALFANVLSKQILITKILSDSFSFILLVTYIIRWHFLHEAIIKSKSDNNEDKTDEWKYVKWPFYLQFFTNVTVILLAVIIFFPYELWHFYINNVLMLGILNIYLTFYAIELIVYMISVNWVGAFSSEYKKEIGTFYDNFSGYMDYEKIIGIIYNSQELDVFLKDSGTSKRDAENIIANLRMLKKLNLDAYLELENKIEYKIKKSMVGTSAMFISIVGIFASQYYSSIINGIAEMNKEQNYFHDLIYGMGLGLMISVFIVWYQNIKFENSKEYYGKILKLFQKADEK